MRIVAGAPSRTLPCGAEGTLHPSHRRPRPPGPVQCPRTRAVGRPIWRTSGPSICSPDRARWGWRRCRAERPSACLSTPIRTPPSPSPPTSPPCAKRAARPSADGTPRGCRHASPPPQGEEDPEGVEGATLPRPRQVRPRPGLRPYSPQRGKRRFLTTSSFSTRHMGPGSPNRRSLRSAVAVGWRRRRWRSLNGGPGNRRRQPPDSRSLDNRAWGAARVWFLRLE